MPDHHYSIGATFVRGEHHGEGDSKQQERRVLHTQETPASLRARPALASQTREIFMFRSVDYRTIGCPGRVGKFTLENHTDAYADKPTRASGCPSRTFLDSD